ncbi:MAG: thymidine phosphorylase [Bacilli bacterium]
MNIEKIIIKKGNNNVLTNEELNYAFNGYLKGLISDLEMTRLLKAICKNSMNIDEISNLTDIFINSGKILDLSDISGVKVDKHSTGGVGDKTTFIIGSIAAACGVKVPKMSGRSLGHTGGTIDKLESIPNVKSSLTISEFIKQVKEIGFAITSQTDDLVPLDKVIYALRDITNTVESIPLIASSIMSKKIASGADKILIDIKYGDGALIKTKDLAKELSEIMINIGKKYDKEVRTIYSDMSYPLGYAIGNNLEIFEVLSILKNDKLFFKDVNQNLRNLCIELATNMVSMGLNISIEDAKEKVLTVLNNKEALNKFYEVIKYQNGDLKSLKNNYIPISIISKTNGTLKGIKTKKLGQLLTILGGGRITKDDIIDYEAGIVLNKNLNDNIKVGDVLAYIYTKRRISLDINDLFIII